MGQTPTLKELLEECQESALHLEMRDGYMRDDPMFIAWQAGHRDDPQDRPSWWRPWLDVIAQTVERGVTVRRARIISEPVSDYIRFEYDVTFTNVAAGEQVRWLPRRQATDLALPGNDFWLLDNRRLLVIHFSGDGNVVDREIIENSAVVALCSQAFEAVWERATPHAQYKVN
ncbi:DUF6879 family protein [Kitasatospora sp. NPDC058170]|uniref:DUF6879 family protein n=1 Tax=Kitasatospora sp. NPDC058170 TaxID=3346364 RepID=UPI0036DEC729